MAGPYLACQRLQAARLFSPALRRHNLLRPQYPAPADDVHSARKIHRRRRSSRRSVRSKPTPSPELSETPDRRSQMLPARTTSESHPSTIAAARRKEAAKTPVLDAPPDNPCELQA